MERFILISGCSGGGKSTLLAELYRRGYHVVEEPGRRIVAQQLALNGNALPWQNLAAFAKKAIELSRQDRHDAETHSGLIFFDRGLIDAAAALEFATSEPALNSVSAERYHSIVFLAPPWPEIYVTDSERLHSFAQAAAEFDRLLAAFTKLNYEIEILPYTSVPDRADFILSRLTRPHSPKV
jgi:predicted ATPase